MNRSHVFRHIFLVLSLEEAFKTTALVVFPLHDKWTEGRLTRLEFEYMFKQRVSFAMFATTGCNGS